MCACVCVRHCLTCEHILFVDAFHRENDLMYLALLFLCVAAEGQMDCVLQLVNMEHSSDIIDSLDTHGQ